MKKGICIFALAVASLLIFTAAASAFEVCLGLSNFGNVYRLEFTQEGRFWNVVGTDCVFGPRAQSGALNPARFGVLTLGFTSHGLDGSATDIHFRANISTSTLSGSYWGWRDRFGDLISGTMSVVNCTACSFSEATGPDAAAE